MKTGCGTSERSLVWNDSGCGNWSATWLFSLGAKVKSLLLSWWTSAAPSDPRWNRSSWWRGTPAHLCVAAGRVCAWLAWQPGLDIQHLSGDSFFRGCEVTPRNICWGGGDPCNQPRKAPRPTARALLVASFHAPTRAQPVHKSDIQIFISGVARRKQQMHSLGEI